MHKWEGQGTLEHERPRLIHSCSEGQLLSQPFLSEVSAIRGSSAHLQLQKARSVPWLMRPASVILALQLPAALEGVSFLPASELSGKGQGRAALWDPSLAPHSSPPAWVEGITGGPSGISTLPNLIE